LTAQPPSQSPGSGQPDVTRPIDVPAQLTAGAKDTARRAHRADSLRGRRREQLHPNNSPILYDEVRLGRTDGPAENLLENPGFEEGFEGWGHSSYIAPEVISTTTVIADDAWHTVGLTYDPPALGLYVDGRGENAVRIRLRPFPRFGRWTIGSRRYTGSADNFVGLLDDLVVARRALTAGQVAEYHRSGLRRMEYAGRAGCIYLRQGEPHTAVRGGRAWLPVCLSGAP